MAILTFNGSLIKNTTIPVIMDKLELLDKVSSNIYFNAISKWSRVTFEYKNSTGQSHLINFENNGSEVYPNSYIHFNTTAITGTWEVQYALLRDWDNKKMMLPRSSLPGLDINLT